MRFSRLLMGLACFAVGWGAFAPKTADALWRRYNAVSCYADNTYYTPPIYNSDNGGSDTFWVSGGGTDLVCPIDDDSYFPKTSISGVNIHGQVVTSGTNVAARACRTYWSTSGGACNAEVTAGYGNFTLQPSVGQWTSGGSDFGYFWIEGSGTIRVRGYYVY
ncbi:MAG: hypothetical protein R3B07_21565 [Polyangiaceae bacterium]